MQPRFVFLVGLVVLIGGCDEKKTAGEETSVDSIVGKWTQDNKNYIEFQPDGVLIYHYPVRKGDSKEVSASWRRIGEGRIEVKRISKGERIIESFSVDVDEQKLRLTGGMRYSRLAEKEVRQIIEYWRYVPPPPNTHLAELKRAAASGNIKKRAYQTTSDNGQMIILRSANEVELREKRDAFVGTYSIDGESLRAVFEILGTKEAYYYEITHEGLKDRNSRRIYYTSALREEKVAEIRKSRVERGINNALRMSADTEMEEGVEERLKKWIDRGASISNTDSNGVTALHCAIGFRNRAAVAYLVKLNAPLEAKTKDNGFTPLHTVIWYPRFRKGHLPDDEVAKRTEEILRTLVAAGANVNAVGKDGATPLILAMKRHRDTLIPILVEAGADLDVRDASGKSAEDYAISPARKELLQRKN